jgi:hypothetical protein
MAGSKIMVGLCILVVASSSHRGHGRGACGNMAMLAASAVLSTAG